MKKIFTIIILTAGALLAGCSNPEEKAARAVVERTFGKEKTAKVKFRLTEKSGDGCDGYATEVRGGNLYVEGSSAVAMCRGFYDYITSNGYGIASWTGNRLDFPESLPDAPRKEVRSPFRDRLYYNVCTFGYTTPYWGWEEWEREIDWMALHGFDMPLAPIAGEAILARVWRGLGLSDEEIGELFTAPGHMPWMRMGNMSGLDGPPTQEWHKMQIALQHRINERMLALGMKPVYQGFAGFVPPAMQEHFPEITLTETKWQGFKSWMMSPTDSLFTVIGSSYITEWEKEFGKGKYYLIDSFNELEIPFGEKGSQERHGGLRSYSEVIYKTIGAVNPDAVWVMQGWMFGYHPNYWDPQGVEALLSGAPDGKLMIIDLAVDFNEFVWRSPKSWDNFDGFYGKDWIFSTVPNFGGRSAVTGALEFYANGHLKALSSPNRGNLTGFGTSPEGIEQNEVVYDIIADAGWRSEEVDIREWLERYSVARYGACPPQMAGFWEGMLNSTHRTFTNNARFRWQMRPLYQRKPMMGINDHYFAAIEKFLECSDELSGNELYRRDAIQYAAFYLAAKADIALNAANWSYVRGNLKAAEAHEQTFMKLLRDADMLLESHPVLRLERWIGFARAAAGTPGESDTFERDARRLISVWGGPSLSDYSARIWSGLIRDFYVRRWEKYFEIQKNPAPFDFVPYDEEWVNDRGVSTIEPLTEEEAVAEAKRLVAESASVTRSIVNAPANAISLWTPFNFLNDKATIFCTIDSELLPYVKGVRITTPNGAESVAVERVRFVSDRLTRGETRTSITLGPERRSATIPVKIEIPDKLPAEVNVYVYLKGAPGINSYGSIELDFGNAQPPIPVTNF